MDAGYAEKGRGKEESHIWIWMGNPYRDMEDMERKGTDDIVHIAGRSHWGIWNGEDGGKARTRESHDIMEGLAGK